jgi:peptidoglycan hydrolase-like protein with peptidoglycan-binding domain
MLISKLLSGSEKLQQCVLKDAAHVTPGAKGNEVRLIQQALVIVGNYVIEANERKEFFYGRSTAKAVLDYKTKRRIVNLTYQTKPDDIVGKMTITALDLEVFKSEKKVDYENFNTAYRTQYR